MTDLRFDVEPLMEQLGSHPEVWNQITLRTQFPSSPHREVDDVWIRYAPDWHEFYTPHTSIWYPASETLTQAKVLCLDLSERVSAERLGGVLITRIAPGAQVYPHVDPGWHARFYDKFVIQIRGNLRQRFCFEDEELSAETGQCYWFDNQFEHWVKNESDEDRVSLIVCLRKPKCHLQ